MTSAFDFLQPVETSGVLVGFKPAVEESLFVSTCVGFISKKHSDCLEDPTIDPEQYIRVNLPAKMHCLTDMHRLRNIGAYNYVFTIYGRGKDALQVYDWPVDRVLTLKKTPPNPLDTIDDEMWANPLAVIFHTPDIDRTQYLCNQDLASILAMRNYLWNEDPFYLKTADFGKLKFLIGDLVKRGVIQAKGNLLFPPTDMGRRVRKSEAQRALPFLPIHPSFKLLVKRKMIQVPQAQHLIVELDLIPPPDKVTFVVDMSADKWNKKEWDANKNNVRRILFLFRNNTDRAFAMNTPHYFDERTTRLQATASSLQADIPDTRLTFLSGIKLFRGNN